MTEADVQTPLEVYQELIGARWCQVLLAAAVGRGVRQGSKLRWTTGTCIFPHCTALRSLLLTAADGYDVDYLRVPVTDEKAPKPADFQLLIQVR